MFYSKYVYNFILVMIHSNISYSICFNLISAILSHHISYIKCYNIRYIMLYYTMILNYSVWFNKPSPHTPTYNSIQYVK